MKDYLSVIRSARLFSGISEEELTPMLTCLKAEKKDFTKETFVLRTGDTADAIGLVLSGTVLIMQEDIWGNRNIPRRDRDRLLLPHMPALPAPG